MNSHELKKYVDPEQPLAFEIETARNNCKAKCSYCQLSRGHGGKSQTLMDEFLFYQIIEQISQIEYNGRLKAPLIKPHGIGDPLLDPRIADVDGKCSAHPFIPYILEKVPNAQVLIYTNARSITKEIFQRLVDCGDVSFAITQHETLPQLRAANISLEDVMAHPTKLREILPPNIKELFDHLDKKADLDLARRVSYFALPIRVPYHSWANDEMLRPSVAAEGPLHNRGGILAGHPYAQGKAHWCYGYKLLQETITVDGNLVFCPDLHFHPEAVVGNVSEGLINVWNKPEYKRLRENLASGIADKECCRKCNYFNYEA